MKKLLTFLFLLACNSSLQAQPASGIAPNFTLKDLNGNWHTLYTYLDQGKTVFIEFSAAWCQPCWNFHNSNVFKTLYQQHGPAGMSGVNGNTTDDVMVLFIEGEPNNTTAQLYGITGTGSAQTTLGNWVSGTPFPIIDTNATTTNALLNAWGITSYPTILMICRDRLVYKYNQQPASQLYSAANFTCPNYPPSQNVDAKTLSYKDKGYFFCTPNPQVRFQNYSVSNNITNATINIFSNSTQIHSYNWTGNLAPFQIANVQIPPFSANPFDGYRFEVQVTGDNQLTNNKSDNALFSVYSAPNAAALPLNEDFETTGIMPAKFKASSYYVEPITNSLTNPVVYVKGVNGQNTRAVRFHNRLMSWYRTLDLVAGNYNTQVPGSVKLEFDVAYAQYDGKENDTLEVLVSKDCGTTWNTVWLKSGDTLKTRTPVGNFTDFYPQQASEWRHEVADLTTYKDPNMLIQFRTHCNNGNDIWIDNLKIHSTTSVDETRIHKPELRVYPNPGNDFVQLKTNLPYDASGRLVITNATGQVVLQEENAVLSDQNAQTITVAHLPSGLYHVSFICKEGTFTSRLSILR